MGHLYGFARSICVPVEKPGSPFRPSTFALFPGAIWGPAFLLGQWVRPAVTDLLTVFSKGSKGTQKTDEDWISLNFFVVS